MDLRYPIGQFKMDDNVDAAARQRFIDVIAETPAKMRAAIAGLSPEQLATPYRDGGWTVRQVVHHVADSHANSFMRFKLALTEDEPTIKPYDESAWAALPDGSDAPVEISLTLLDALHERWVYLLKSLRAEDYARTFKHPERGLMTLDNNLALYAWHGPHHVAHITALRERLSWKSNAA
jgi:uncharacterized damage-inducible protein DinB